MAMGKNRLGIMAAISAAEAASAESKSSSTRARAYPSLPKGTAGSVRAGAGVVQEIAPEQILPWGPADRLSMSLGIDAVSPNDDADGGLEASISANGQQVPVLLRPAAQQDGRFEVVYGRRRIEACARLGILVKAIIRPMDDLEALVAKGLENAGRVDLTFYEKARFAAQILELGYTRQQTQEAMAISKNTLSQLEKVTRNVPIPVGEAIGPAPASGRPKWTSLATAFEAGKLTAEHAIAHLAEAPAASSDQKLDLLIVLANRRGTKAVKRDYDEPAPGVTIKSGKSAISLSIERARVDPGYDAWLDANLGQIIRDSYDRFRTKNPVGGRE